MKKFDVILFSIVVLISVGFFIFFNQREGDLDKEVVISSSGEVIAQVKLDGTEYEFMVENEHGYNLVRVDVDGVYVAEADCPDQDCVEIGRISKVGQSIICAPNYLVIEVIGSQSNSLDAISV